MSNIKKQSAANAAPGRGRPKTKSDDAQRKLIADRAWEMFLENGYGRTTTDAIATDCRISKQTLYRLFPGKPALFTSIVDQHRLSMLALPGDYDSLPLDKALEQIFNIDITPAAHAKRMGLIDLVLLEAKRHPELEEIIHNHGADPSLDELAKWLKRRAKREAIDIGHAKHSARLLMTMIFGPFAPPSRGKRPRLRTEDIAEHIRRCVFVFLNGVRAR